MLKICSKCKKEKLLSEFRKIGKNKDGSTKYRAECKECEKFARKNRNQNKSKEIPKNGYKFCPCCKKELSLSEFRQLPNGKPFSYCKLCTREKDRQRYKHTCSQCGKEYRSGKKKTSVCRDCHSINFSKIGSKVLKKLDKHGENNPMYGIQRFGENNPNYNPNISEEEREKGRILEGYSIWRRNVYERDNYTCQCCGDKKGGNLQAHHLDGYNWAKDKRTDIDNGITLCEKCHKDFHYKYGNGNNTKEQFEEFLLNKFYKKSA